MLQYRHWIVYFIGKSNKLKLAKVKFEHKEVEDRLLKKRLLHSLVIL